MSTLAPRQDHIDEIQDYLPGNDCFETEYFFFREMLGEDPIWRFGIEPEGIDGLLAGFGWREVEHLGWRWAGAGATFCAQRTAG